MRGHWWENPLDQAVPEARKVSSPGYSVTPAKKIPVYLSQFELGFYQLKQLKHPNGYKEERKTAISGRSPVLACNVT